MHRFKIGDRIILARHHNNPFFRISAIVGKATGTVVTREMLPSVNPLIDDSKYVIIKWDDNEFRQNQSHGGYSPEWFDLIDSPKKSGSQIELAEGEVVVGGYEKNAAHYAITNFGNLWKLNMDVDRNEYRKWRKVND